MVTKKCFVLVTITENLLVGEGLISLALLAQSEVMSSDRFRQPMRKGCGVVLEPLEVQGLGL